MRAAHAVLPQHGRGGVGLRAFKRGELVMLLLALRRLVDAGHAAAAAAGAPGGAAGAAGRWRAAGQARALGRMVISALRGALEQPPLGGGPRAAAGGQQGGPLAGGGGLAAQDVCNLLSLVEWVRARGEEAGGGGGWGAGGGRDGGGGGGAAGFPATAAMAASLVRASEGRLHEFSGQGLSSLAAGAARLGVRPPSRWLDALCHEVGRSPHWGAVMGEGRAV
jgi:hypothetical protein